MKMIEPHRPDIQIIFPNEWTHEADSADDLISRVIEALAESDFQVTSTLLPELREELKEFEQAHQAGDKTARHKDYDLYNLLVQVLTDVYQGQARSGKNYFDRKTDLITYQTHYQTVVGIDKNGSEKEGLKVKLHLVKR
jgi:hypothetical protein